MSPLLITGLLIVAALVVWVALQGLGTQKKSEAIESQMNELRRDMQSVANALKDYRPAANGGWMDRNPVPAA